MVTAVDKAKRALVRVLQQLAVLYNCALNLTRDSADDAVHRAGTPTARGRRGGRHGGGSLVAQAREKRRPRGRCFQRRG